MTPELHADAMVFTAPNGSEELIVQSLGGDADAQHWVGTMAEQTDGTAVVRLRDGSRFRWLRNWAD